MGVLNFLTGTAGYTAILAAFGLAVAAHFVAPRAWSALAWWGESVPDAEGATVEQVTRRVNGGTNGLDDRRRLFERALRVLEDA